MKIVQNNLKIEEKFSDVPKKFKSRPPTSRVCRVSGNETFCFLALAHQHPNSPVLWSGNLLQSLLHVCGRHCLIQTKNTTSCSYVLSDGPRSS